MSRRLIFTIIGPGILVAATGVGAGDLATAALTGTRLGITILWAVLAGALFKFVLTEGLTRWQLATGETILEGAMTRFGRWPRYMFLIYFAVWSFMVAAALMSACGVTAQAMFPIFVRDRTCFGCLPTGKIIYGIAHSLLGVVLVRLGGYRLFEKAMGACIGLMFVTVLATAAFLRPDLGELLRGMFIPRIPEIGGEGLSWTIALMGGVGGTVTILCYGYWIREKGRFRPDDLKICRIDLAVGYIVTAVFGLAMVIIGSTIEVEGRGATLIIRMAEKLGAELGTAGKWAFLIGAWGAVFSSLLGVWQSIPYLFSDLLGIMRSGEPTSERTIDTGLRSYRWCLFLLATVPMLGLGVGFARMQKLYAIVGAMFIPMLALALLVLCSRSRWIGRRYRNRPITTVMLVVILVFFVSAAWLTVRNLFA